MCALTTTCGDLVSNPNAVTVILPASAELIVLIGIVDDLTDRVAPTLSGEAGARMRVLLRAVSTALRATDAPAADRALTEARAAYDAYRQSSDASPGDAPDLGAIDLALIYVAAGIQRPCASNSVASAAPTSVLAFAASTGCGTR